MDYDYLLTIALILVSTKLFSIITSKFQLPQVVGALLAGLILGPAVLGLLQPSELLNDLAEVGVIVIMFTAGMETNIEDLKKCGGVGFAVALCGVLVPLVSGAALMHFFNNQATLLQCIFLGTVLTATSVSITVATLKEMGKLTTKVGTTILAAALIDDILGLICLTIVTSLSGGNANIGMVLLKVVGFFASSFVIGWTYHKGMIWYDKKVNNANLHRFPVFAFALCLFMAWFAEAVFGVADIIGSFTAGVIIAMSPKGEYISSKFGPLSYLLLTPIFFANIGLKISLSSMNASMIIFTICLVITGVLSKMIGCGIAAKISKFTNKEALQIGVGMVCRGEVALIVANKGTSMGLLSADYYGPIIILVICCAILTPILLKMVFQDK